MEPSKQQHWTSDVSVTRLAGATRALRIQKLFYPGFPPDRNAEDVIAWLKSRAQLGAAGDAPGARP